MTFCTLSDFHKRRTQEKWLGSMVDSCGVRWKNEPGVFVKSMNMNAQGTSTFPFPVKLFV